MPGVVCGGKLSRASVDARSKGCTEASLKSLKGLEHFKRWERGEDLGAPAAGLASLLKKVFIVLLVTVFAVGASIYREKSASVVTMDRSGVADQPLELPVPEEEVALGETASVSEPSSVDTSEPPSITVPPENIYPKLQEQLDDLQLQVKMEKARAAQAKEKEDSMFSALEASTHKVHEMSRELRESKSQVELLQSKVKLSVRHSEAIMSVDRVLLGLEALLVISSLVAYLKAHRIRNAMLKARRSFIMAYRRQQRVLAVAEEVYVDAMKYNQEVEAADVRPRTADTSRELNPWDSLLDDMESLIKSNLPNRLGRGATPLQVVQALAAHFAELKKATGDMEGKVEETRRALESSVAAVKTLEGDLGATKREVEQTAKALQTESARTKELSTSLASAEAKASGLEDQMRAVSEEKTLLSEELLKAKEELEKVTAYASSLESAGFAARGPAPGGVVKDHLREFSDAMDLHGPGDGANADYADYADDEDRSAGSDGIDEALLGERLQRIKQLIREANDSPFELLSPNTGTYEGTDAGTALRNLPVIGTMHISSSDSEDEDFNARQDASVQRMLDTSALLSSQVAEYVEILKDDAGSHLVGDLKKTRDAVDAQRKQVEVLVHNSQKEARACRALKVKRKEVDFLSEKEEIMHGEDELKAADRLFFARKKEKDAMLELQKGQAALRAALETARQQVRAS